MRDSYQTKLVSAEHNAPRVPRRSYVVRAVVLLVLALTVAAAVLGTYFALWRSDDNPGKKPLWADADPYNRWEYEHEGLHQPEVVSDDGTYTAGKVLIDSKNGHGKLELTYNATVTQDWERIICLDVDRRVQGVECRGDILTITWSSPEVAQEAKRMVQGHALSSPTLVTGGASWACRLEEANAAAAAASDAAADGTATSVAGRTVLHRVGEVVEVSGSAIALRVSPASYTDIFHHLHVHLQTHQPRPAGADDLVHEPLNDTPYANRSTTVTNDGGINWGFVGKFLRAVAAVVRSAPVIEKAANWAGDIVNGDMQLGPDSPINLKTWTWTGGQATLPGGVNLDISKSNAKLALGVLFNIDIESWKLVSADLAVEGEARATAHAQVSSDREWKFDQHFPLFQNVGIGEVTFMVGPVPFHIAGQLDLDLLLEADGNAGASFSAGATASAAVRGGITFKNGQWQGVTSKNWGVNRIEPKITASANGNVIFSLIPSVTLIASWIGGPTVSMVPYIATNLAASDSSCDATIGWGVGIQVGARIDLRNPVTGSSLGCNGCTHTWGQQEIWTTNNGQPQPLYECDGQFCGNCR